MSDFDEFYSLYPKHVDVADARKAWAKAIQRTPGGRIIAGLRLHLDAGTFERKIEDARKQGQPAKQFIRSPARWLRCENWNDELPERVTRPQFRNGALEALARHTETNWAGFDDNLIEGPTNG
jgi:hypothetical protein